MRREGARIRIAAGNRSEASQRAASEKDAAVPKLPEAVDLFRAIFADSNDDDVHQKPAVAAAIRADAVTNSDDALLEPNPVTQKLLPKRIACAHWCKQYCWTHSLVKANLRAQAQLSMYQTPIATV